MGAACLCEGVDKVLIKYTDLKPHMQQQSPYSCLHDTSLYHVLSSFQMDTESRVEIFVEKY
jgi:hypothetical protein